MNIKIIGIGAVLIVAILIAGMFTGIIPIAGIGYNRMDIKPVTVSMVYSEEGLYYRGCFDGTREHELITNTVGNAYRSEFILGRADGRSELIVVEGLAYTNTEIPYLGVIGIFGGLNHWASDIEGRKIPTAHYEIEFISSIGESGYSDWTTILDEKGKKETWLSYSIERMGGIFDEGDEQGNFRFASFSPKPLWNVLTIGALKFYIHGYHPGAIRVKLVGYVRQPEGLWGLGGLIGMQTVNEVILAQDEAEILPSEGSIVRVSEATIEAGEDIVIKVETQFSDEGIDVDLSDIPGNGGGYKLTVWNPDGALVETIDLSDNFYGTKNIHTQPDWYRTDWTNKAMANIYTIVLENRWHKLGEIDAATCPLEGLRPALCIITHSQEEYSAKTGETVHIAFSALEKEGAVAVIGFKYCVFYGEHTQSAMPADGSSLWVIPRYRVADATKSGNEYTGHANFYAPGRQGWVTILAWTLGTEDILATEQSSLSIFIYLKDEDKPDVSELPSTAITQGIYKGGKTSGMFDWLLPAPPPPDEEMDYWGIVLAIILAIIVALVTFRFIPAPLPYKIGIALIIAIVVIAVINHLYYVVFAGGII